MPWRRPYGATGSDRMSIEIRPCEQHLTGDPDPARSVGTLRDARRATRDATRERRGRPRARQDAGRGRRPPRGDRGGRQRPVRQPRHRGGDHGPDRRGGRPAAVVDLLLVPLEVRRPRRRSSSGSTGSRSPSSSESCRPQGLWPCGSTAWCVRTCWRCAAFPFDINEIHRLAHAVARRLRRRTGTSAAASTRRSRPSSPRACATGELRPVDARLAARTLLAADEATQHWFRTGPAATTPPRIAGTWPTSGPRLTARTLRSSPTTDAARLGPPRWLANVSLPPPDADPSGSAVGSDLAARPASGRARRRRRRAARRGRRRCRRPRRPGTARCSARRNVVGSTAQLELARLRRRPAGRAARRPRPGRTRSWSKGRSSHGTSGSPPASGGRGTRPARCDRRTGSRPGPPSRRRRGRPRRCRRRSPGVHVRAGLYLVVTSRWRGSSGVATGRTEVDVAEAQHEVGGVEDDAVHVVDEARPLIRRMNSRFDGHHGASARTTSV